MRTNKGAVMMSLCSKYCRIFCWKSYCSSTENK